MKLRSINALLLLAALLVLGPGGLGGPGFAAAQWPNYMMPDKGKKEKSSEGKPPGQMEPGPQGTSKFGWRNVQKGPGAKGAQSQGWQTGKPLEHKAPSKPATPARHVPQETKAPKTPPQPKGPKSSQDLDFAQPEPATRKGMPAAAPQPASPFEEKPDASKQP